MTASGPAHDTASPAARGALAAASDAALTVTERNRLRWRCRRGMLENDIILARFLDARGTALTNAQVTALDRLLALTDNELWDLLSARVETTDVALVAVLQELRAA